jgi:hypothetical protein
MAVAVDMTFEGGTLDQYDEVMAKMGLVRGGPLPPGAISHFVTKTDDGIRVVDVWESQEAFGKFAEEQIGPFTRELGLPEPEISFHDVHNYLTG